MIGSWVGLIFNLLILAAQFWIGFAPIGYRDMTVSARVNNFFQAYLAAPIVIFLYIMYKFRFKTKIIRTRDMDLHSGRRDFDLTFLMAMEKEERKQWPAWKKVYKFFC